MTDKNLLAMLRHGDEDHYMIQDFLESLPDGSKKLFDSRGYVGGLEQNLQNSKIKLRIDRRHFVLFRLPKADTLVTEYFSKTPEAALIEIPDRLKIKTIYMQEETFSDDYHFITQFDTGSIDDMVKKYQELSSQDHGKLLIDGLSKSEMMRNTMIKKRFFGLGKAKLASTYVAVGLETVDGNYTIVDTGAHGPYAVTFDKKK